MKTWTIFSVKKATLPLRWVSSHGPFDCRSNALSSELRRFHKTFRTESIYANLATDISWTVYKFFQIISVDYVDNYKSVSLTIINELYHIDLINLWFRVNDIIDRNDRVFDRQSKGPSLDTQRSGSVPFFTEKIVQIYIENSIWS